MLIVETIGRIRREHLDKGKSIREIARTLHLSRNTVRRILRSGETAFSYEREVQPRPKLGAWADELDRLLAANAKAPARERLTLIRVYEELRALGYEGGYDAVRRYARRWGEQYASATAEAYIPLTFAPGEAYQFDSHGVLPVKRFRCSRARLGRPPVLKVFQGVSGRFDMSPFFRAVLICRHSLLAAKMASARRGSRMRSTGEAGRREAHVLCAGHVRRLGGASPLCNLMEVKH